MDGEKKLRFFGDGDAFGDGGAWVHIGDNADQVVSQVRMWMENVVTAGDVNEHCEIKTRMMTDAEVEALPEI